MPPSLSVARWRHRGKYDEHSGNQRNVRAMISQLPSTMRAMLLERPGTPLLERTLPMPAPEPNDLLLRVLACGVCRTDLHIVDGDLPLLHGPTIPGHEIVGRVVAKGSAVGRFSIGDRVGVPWLGATCGHCDYCKSNRENLCDTPSFTGYDRNGGYAEYVAADARFCFPLPEEYDDVHAAPLLCAGLIGYRALRFAEQARTLGIYGFGAAAHLIAQVAIWQGRTVYAFTREADDDGRRFARELGVSWAGASTEPPPTALDAALIFAPVGSLVPAALRACRKGGVVVCAGIHMSDIPSFPYDILWGERVIRSVANLTRGDAEEFLKIAPEIPIRTTVEAFPLTRANEAIDAVRSGRLHGAAVLTCSDPSIPMQR